MMFITLVLIELLNYSMVKQYLETIQFLISPDKKVRFNKRGNRLYIDMNWQRDADTQMSF